MDDDGKFVWNQESDSSSDESAPDSEEDVMSEASFWSNKSDIKYAETSNSRIAVQNLDWDHISADDLYFLFNSFCKPTMMIHKVVIYPSDYGKQMMERDAIYGPPKEIFENKAAKNPMKNIKKKERKVIHSKQQAFQSEENHEFNQMKLREYEAQKMKYFFAVVYCDSEETASHLYGEIDGLEFEQSLLKMDLRFVPDEIKSFPNAPKETCSEVPEDYQCNFFVNRTFGHTRVKLTWEEEDPKKIKIIKRKLDPKRMEEEDFRDYIASNSEGEEENPDEIARKRALLGLDKDSEEESDSSDAEMDNIIGVKKKSTEKVSSGDLKITFKSGFEDIGENLLKAKQDKDMKKNESNFEKYQRERKEKRRERKQREKEKKDLDKEMQYEVPDESAPKKHHKKGPKLSEMLNKNAATPEEIDLLMNSKNETEEFKPDPTDKRFTSIYENGAYTMDPTNKEFKKVGKAFIHEQAKKRRKNYE